MGLAGFLESNRFWLGRFRHIFFPLCRSSQLCLHWSQLCLVPNIWSLYVYSWLSLGNFIDCSEYWGDFLLSENSTTNYNLWKLSLWFLEKASADLSSSQLQPLVHRSSAAQELDNIWQVLYTSGPYGRLFCL